MIESRIADIASTITGSLQSNQAEDAELLDSVRLLTRLVADVPALPPNELPSAIKAIERGSPVWKKAQRRSQLSEDVRQALSDLVQAVERVFWKV